jgi:hypothetical protein
MIEIIGKYNAALCYTNQLEPEAYSQILTVCDMEAFRDSKIRIMPDVHAGKGCTIGTTMTITDRVVPNLVGVQNPRASDGPKRVNAAPMREFNPDDIFMDEVHHEDAYDDEYDDAYDRTELDDDDDDFIDDFEFEEKEHGGFFQRHIRGIVGLLLFLLLLVICAVWAFSPKGQLVLAKMNLAWTPQVYADLGYAAYQQDSDKLAARYYEKALARDESNYEYAHSAMVAYYDAGETESAAAMLKKCIEMDPDNPEPYQEMLILYPDDESRPWEITELIRLGYQRTGHEALKLG